MQTVRRSKPENWLSNEITEDKSWIFELAPDAADDIVRAVRKAAEARKPLLDYCKEDFDFGSTSTTLDAAFNLAKHGCGMALVRNLPRNVLSDKEYELMTWGIGLHQGVARPQGKDSQYISAVRDVGVDYRSATGRGYSSSAELDFHTDRSDIIVLTCYNRALSGGKSMVVSTAAAYERFVERHPELVKFTKIPLYFSRQGEVREGEGPTFSHPLVTEADGRLFVRWNRNRAVTAQEYPEVPRMADELWSALNTFDALLHEPEIEYSMYLEPGDMQILNGNVTLHARTNYTDSSDPAKKRLVYRLWLATPDSVRLPDEWLGAYRCTQPGAVRGGILGNAYNDRCREFDQRQAAALGMTYDLEAHR